jgi:ubiquitin-protein ligase
MALYPSRCVKQQKKKKKKKKKKKQPLTNSSPRSPQLHAGPPGTPFENGLYHGRILLPPDYPFKPPNIVLLTPSGRWETGKRICLSVSAHHPEEWQPAWGIRTILQALRDFITTPADGALGALEYTDEERRALAARWAQAVIIIIIIIIIFP